MLLFAKYVDSSFAHEHRSRPFKGYSSILAWLYYSLSHIRLLLSELFYMLEVNSVSHIPRAINALSSVTYTQNCL
jgi:hypothetical protein